MIRFHQTFGAHTGRVCEFEGDRVCFGRMPDSDMAFDANADLDASGRHSEARLEAGQWVLVDVGSRNGTYVNGNRVERAGLQDGDEIEFGLGGPRVRVEMGEPGIEGQQPRVSVSPKQFGEHTVGQMIQSAVEQAKAGIAQGGPAPADVGGPAGAAAPRTPKGVKVTVALLSLLLAAALVVIAVLAWIAFVERG